MRKKIISISLTTSILLSIFFQCLFPVTVCALSLGGLQSTIASIIISLMLECGVAPVNNAWLQTLNTSYGATSSIGTIQDCIESGLLTQTATGLVDSGLSTAIESAPAYTDLGLGEIFTTTADDAALGVVAGSGGYNIATTAINVGTLGTIGAYAGAAGIGVGIGVLVNHMREAFNNFIRSGVKITYDSDIINACPNDKTVYYNSYGSSGNRYRTCYYYVPHDMLVCSYLPFQYQFEGLGVSNTNNLTEYDYIGKLGNNSPDEERTYSVGASNPVNLYIPGRVGNWGVPDTNMPIKGNYNEAVNYLKGIINGTIEKESIYSPDLIGRNGNHESNYDNNLGEYVDPYINNVVPNGYDMNPVNMDDYTDFVQNANDNTENDIVGQPIQGENFDDLIDSLLNEPSIIPDQGVTDPDVPERHIIPDQPSVPGKDPITGEEQSEVLQGITTPDLRSVFPFCIPFDLYNIFGVLKYEGREAPVIVWEADFMGITYPVIIDLSPYEDAASILRLMELLLFIVGLAVATRSLIGAGG